MTGGRLYRIVVAGVCWFALALQFQLFVFDPAPPDAATAVINFFSYFTILSNILVALAMTFGVFEPGASGPARFFNRPDVRAAIALYIVVVGLVYAFVLSGRWSPEGWRLVADRLLHYAIPVLYVVDWIALTPKAGLSMSRVPFWLIFPGVYGLYAIARGALTGYYPYFFLDAGALGMVGALINVGLLVAAFAGGGALVVVAARLLARRSP